MIDSPNVEGKSLAEMSENHLQRWMAIEQPGGHQPQRVGAGLDRERPSRRRQPRKSVVNWFAARQWITRVQIEGLAERAGCIPELRKLRAIVVGGIVRRP